MKRCAFPRFKTRASSLIVTLLVIVVLSTIVVAFMQSMSIERMTAQITKNSYRAKLAAEAGMEAAIRQIALGVNTNQAYIVGQTNDSANFGPVLVIGQTNLTNFSQLMPLMSGDFASLNGYPSANSNAVAAYINARTNTNSSSSINVNLRNTLIEVTTNVNKYRAPWTYVTNSDGTTNSRYAYIVLDEWARVNPRYHGDTSLSRSNATNWFPGTGVLPLYTGGTNLLSAAEAASARAIATNTSPSPLTPLTVGQAFASRSAYDAKKHLLTLSDTWSPDVIPADLAEGGKPKYNINELATNAIYGADSETRANRLASIIATNLPGFGARDLGLQTEDPTGVKYLRRLAASIIDYIDADTVPTLVNGGEPAGKELAPYVVMVAERNAWISESTGPPYTVVIRSEFYLQLWNPYTVDVSGNVSLAVLQRQYIDMRDGGSQTDLQDFASPVPVSVSLRPNEMKAYHLGSIDQSFVNNINQPSSSGARYPTWPATSSSSGSLTGHPQFQLTWNGVLLDMNRQEPIMVAPASSGLVRSSPGNSFGNIGARRWAFNYVPSNTPNTVADPRGSWLCASDWAGAANITLANWQGRQTDTGGRTQNLQTAWASRDYVANNATMGIVLTSTNADPTTLTSQYTTNDAKNAPAIIRNAAMRSMGELGNIFDPIQINDTGGNASGGSPASYFRPVGGFSLRIGQPEFTFSSTNGRRSIQLLDLFTVNTTNASSTNFPAIRGRVNVNTASQPVLEALFFNISPTSDINATNSVILQSQAAFLANTVISNRPYSKLSDLYKITPALVNATNYSPVLPANVASNANSPTVAAGILDRAREEPFGKMTELATVQSRAFRLVVIGESLHPVTGKRESRAALEAILSVEQNPSGGLVEEIKYLRWENQ